MECVVARCDGVDHHCVGSREELCFSEHRDAIRESTDGAAECLIGAIEVSGTQPVHP